MRLIRFPAVAALAFALSSCGGSSGSIPSPSSQSAPQRGTVDVAFRVGTLGKALMARGLAGGVIASVGGPPLCDVSLYSIAYETIGVHGERANASAALFVPGAGCKGPFPLVGYAHGTIVVKGQSMTHAISTNPPGTLYDPESLVIASIFAAHGYAVAATDYLGLGLSTYPYHPYVHADSEASAVVDALRAARTAAKRFHVALSGKVFLTGYSQGGHGALATQRAIERDEPTEFNLRGDAPASGPYALTQTFEDSVRHGSQNAPILATYVLTAYQKIYGNVYSDPSDAFRQPYATGIDSLMPVQTPREASALFGTTLPIKIGALLQPSFEQSFLTDPSSGLRTDAAANDLIGPWLPQAPLFLCGGKRDPQVEFKNALTAYAFFKAHGVNVKLLDVDPYIPPSVPISLYHDAVLVFCLPLARMNFFDPRR